MAGEGLSNALAMLDHRVSPVSIQNSFERSARRLVFFLRFYLCCLRFILYARHPIAREETVTVM